MSKHDRPHGFTRAPRLAVGPSPPVLTTTVPCPDCDAPAGTRCTTVKGTPAHPPHPSRRRLAMRAARGE